MFGLFFLSAAPTAQNSPELKIHIKNVAQDTPAGPWYYSVIWIAKLLLFYKIFENFYSRILQMLFHKVFGSIVKHAARLELNNATKWNETKLEHGRISKRLT